MSLRTLSPEPSASANSATSACPKDNYNINGPQLSRLYVMVENILNKKARHDYEVLDRLEAGIVLKGTEVKSIRQGQANLRDSFAMFKGRELFLFNMHISPYDHGNRFNTEAVRPRKLLLHREQIRKLSDRQKEKGFSLIPLSLYFKKGKVKIDLALARGKKQYDRREDIKRRDVDRELRGTNKGRSRGPA